MMVLQRAWKRIFQALLYLLKRFYSDTGGPSLRRGIH